MGVIRRNFNVAVPPKDQFFKDKNTIIPASKLNDTYRVKPDFSTASGKRWINASPKRAPVEKETRKKTIFLKVLSLKGRVKAPANPIRLTIKTASKVKSQVVFTP